MKTRLPLLLVFLFSFALSAHAQLPEAPVDEHYCDPHPRFDCSYYEATAFGPWTELSPKQRQLLSDYFVRNNFGDPESAYYSLAQTNDDFLAAFLSVSNALAHLSMVFADGSSINATELLQNVQELFGDRFYVTVDAQLLNRWDKDGGYFSIAKGDGSFETGNRRFVDHTVFGAAELHPGFDIQWYSGVVHEPRIQINYRIKDSLADIDLDVAVFKWFFVPNISHLRYRGSDMRQYFKTYVKKYGNPGFSVKKRVVAGFDDQQN